MNTVRQISALAAACALLCANVAAQAATAGQGQSTAMTPGVPVAGRANLGTAVIDMEAVISGWSVRKTLLKQAVVNEKNQRIGTVDDIIITPDPDGKMRSASFAIIGVGGFLGLKQHDVAIPVAQLELRDGRLMLPGASREVLKALPEFEYGARKR